MTVHYSKRYRRIFVRDIYRYIFKKKINCLLGITGPVGSGKSETAEGIGLAFDKSFDIDTNTVYTVHDLLEQSLHGVKVKNKPLSLEDLVKIPDVRQWLRDNINNIIIKPGRVIVFDETATGAYVREFMSQDNKTIAKIVQVWRFLRIAVIFVVPEDMDLAESTIRRFLNFEIKMIGTYDKYATCKAWEYKGRNKKTKEPYRHRLRGNRFGGIIKIKPLSYEHRKKYIEISSVHKLGYLVDLGRDYASQTGNFVKGRRLTPEEHAKFVEEHINDFLLPTGKVSENIIKIKRGVTYRDAKTIKELVQINMNQ